MVPKTDDGRVLFAIPWLDRVMVGTTDTPVAEALLEPVAQLEDEVNVPPGARGPLPGPGPAPGGRAERLRRAAAAGGGRRRGRRRHTASLSRDHTLLISESGLVTITGGKWTTYRKMAEDTVDQAATLADLDDRPCVTRELHLHGYPRQRRALRRARPLRLRRARPARAAAQRVPRYAEPLHEAFPIRAGEVVWAVTRHEMARTVEDVLSRRTRALLLDARAAIAAAPTVADAHGRGAGAGRGVGRGPGRGLHPRGPGLPGLTLRPGVTAGRYAFLRRLFSSLVLMPHRRGRPCRDRRVRRT
jgi:glycerol-3-phosphate dehydrogenase